MYIVLKRCSNGLLPGLFQLFRLRQLHLIVLQAHFPREIHLLLHLRQQLLRILQLLLKAAFKRLPNSP